MTPAPPRPRLVCLLVTRDDAGRLPAWLDAVRPLADGIVALDQGSTDGTEFLLEQEPLVGVLLHGAPTDAPEGAGRSASVNRLLDAACELEPEWVLWLDVSERVAPCDVGPLREFLARDALPGLAYGLRTPAGGVAYRLFAHRAGQRVQAGAADDAMVPDGIREELWLATTVTLEPVDAAGPARERLPDTPVLVAAEEPGETEGPTVSAVVVCDGEDTDGIEPVVRALLAQDCPEPFEVVLVTSGGSPSNELSALFPSVEVVEVPAAAPPPEALNAGLGRAGGDYVLVLTPGIRPQPGALAALIRAHDDGHVVVTGRVVNGVPTVPGWASYLLDSTAPLPDPGSSGALSAPASYVRDVLRFHGGFPVPAQLAERAHAADDVILVHDSGCRSAAGLVRHHFRRGAATARVEVAGAPGWRLTSRSVRQAHGLRHLFERVVSAADETRHAPDDVVGAERETRRVVALVALAATAEWAGFRLETARAARRRGLGLARLGFAGAGGSPPAPGSGPEERGHTGAVLDALYPLHPHHPWLVHVPVRIRRGTRRALTHVAVRAHLRRRPDVQIVAITGSAGKTTTKDLVGEVLASIGPTMRTRHNENGLWGVPASLLAIRPTDRFAVLEVGIKRGSGEMRWMAGLFRPRVAVLTGIGVFHSEVVGSPEAIAREKRVLLERLDPSGTAVVNADDPLARAAAEGLACRVVRAGWAEDADVRIVSARPAWPHGFDLELDVHGRRVQGRVGVYGRHLVPLVAAAVAAADALGVPPEAAMDAVGSFSPRVGRFSPAPGPRGSMFIVDDWKSRVPNAVAAVAALGDTQARRRIAVMGEVQVDEQTPETYRPVARALLTAADRLVAVGESGPPLHQLLAGTDLGAGLLQVADAEEAAVALGTDLGAGDVVLLHGAGHHDLELVSLRFDPEADPVWLEDWRLRPFSRVGRPVTEMLTVLETGGDPGMLERHGAALTYVGTTGHRLSVDGRLTASDDSEVVATCTRIGVAPLLVLRGAPPRDAAAADLAAASVVEHVLGHGHRGILLDLDVTVGLTDRSPLERLVDRVSSRLRAEGRWSAMVVRASDASRGAVVPSALDMVVLAPGAAEGSESTEELGRVVAALVQEVPARSILLSCPRASRATGEPSAEISLVRGLGLRGFAVPPESLPSVSALIGHRFQVRRRAWAVSDEPDEQGCAVRRGAPS